MQNHQEQNKNSQWPAYLPPILMLIIAILILWLTKSANTPMWYSQPKQDWLEQQSLERAVRWLSARSDLHRKKELLLSTPLNEWHKIEPKLQIFTTTEAYQNHFAAVNHIPALCPAIMWKHLPLSQKYILIETNNCLIGENPCAASPGMELVAVNDDSEIKTDNLNALNKQTTQTAKLSLKSPNTVNIIQCDYSLQINDTAAIAHYYKIDTSAIYIRLQAIKPKSYNELMSLIEQHFTPEQRFDLFLDLRNCGGEDLDEAALILSQFIDQKGIPLFSLQGKKGKSRAYSSTGKVFFQIDRLKILIDEHTGSAGRLLAISSYYNRQSEIHGVLVNRPICRYDQIALPNGHILRYPASCFSMPDKFKASESFLILPEDELPKLNSFDDTLWEVAYAVFLEWSRNAGQARDSAIGIDELKIKLNNKLYELYPEHTLGILTENEQSNRLYTYFLSFSVGSKQSISKSFIYHPAFKD